jgi:hypothetical protein
LADSSSASGTPQNDSFEEWTVSDLREAQSPENLAHSTLE